MGPTLFRKIKSLFSLSRFGDLIELATAHHFDFVSEAGMLELCCVFIMLVLLHTSISYLCIYIDFYQSDTALLFALLFPVGTVFLIHLIPFSEALSYLSVLFSCVSLSVGMAFARHAWLVSVHRPCVLQFVWVGESCLKRLCEGGMNGTAVCSFAL